MPWILRGDKVQGSPLNDYYILVLVDGVGGPAQFILSAVPHIVWHQQVHGSFKRKDRLSSMLADAAEDKQGQSKYSAGDLRAVIATTPVGIRQGGTLEGWMSISELRPRAVYKSPTEYINCVLKWHADKKEARRVQLDVRGNGDGRGE